ncbi:hypothetical protein NliqN6_4707 [Naganishia liquefaciens]|uniref:Uncharacterized protein n=1 Tax=Naganishia liquefaciens TaxID=104408 RepID=A0A8H3TWX4_9TREE|nr:hypothetical protein NliqN6_4707 [Naganishia liquefaciens]
MPEPLLDSISSRTKEDHSEDPSEDGLLTPDGTRTFPVTYEYQRTAFESGDGVTVHVSSQVFKVVEVQADHQHIARLILEGERRSNRLLKQDRNVDAALTAISERCRDALFKLDLTPQTLHYLAEVRHDPYRYTNEHWVLSETFEVEKPNAADHLQTLDPFQMEFVARALNKDILIWSTDASGTTGEIFHPYSQNPLANAHTREAVFLYYDARKNGAYKVLLPTDPDDDSPSTSSADDSLPASPSLMPRKVIAHSDDRKGDLEDARTSTHLTAPVPEPRMSDITSTLRITDLSLSDVQRSDLTAHNLYDWASSIFEDEDFLKVMGDPNEDGSLWNKVARVISTGAYKNPLRIYPLVCGVAFGNKTQFVKQGPFWVEGAFSFVEGILLLAQRYPRVSLAQEASQRATRARASNLGVFAPGVDSLEDEDWGNAYQHCSELPHFRKNPDFLNSRGARPDNMFKTFRKQFQQSNSKGYRDPSDGRIWTAKEMGDILQIASALGVRFAQAQEPDRVIYENLSSKKNTFLSRGRKARRACNEMKRKFSNSKEFHNWCASEEDACQLIVSQEELRRVFGEAVATAAEFDSFYTNLWNKGLKRELALEAKEEYLRDGAVLEPFYRHSKYSFDPLGDEKDIKGAASTVRCMEMYRRVAALKDARKHAVSFGSDSNDKAQDAFLKDFLSATDINQTIDKVEVRLQAGRLVKEPSAVGIVLTAAQGGVASAFRVDDEANHSVQDNLPAPSAASEILKGVIPQPLVLNKPERKKHCRILGKALQADSLVLQSLDGMRLTSLANGMASIVAQSRAGLIATTSTMSLADIEQMCQDAAKTSRLGNFNSILMQSSLIGIGKILAMLQVYQRASGDADYLWETMKNLETLCRRVLAIMAMRCYSRRYYIYSAALTGLLERSTADILSLAPEGAADMPVKECLFAFRQLSESILHCTGHAARSAMIQLDIANQRRWIEGSLNWEKAIGVNSPISNRLTCPWGCGVPLTLSPEVATTAFRGVPHDTRLSVCVYIRRGISGLWSALNLLGKVEAHPCLVNFITRYPFHPIALIELNSFATLSHMTCKASRGKAPLIAAQDERASRKDWGLPFRRMK